MKKQSHKFALLAIIFAICHVFLWQSMAIEEKDWQGKGYENRFTASILGGLVLEKSAGFSLIGILGTKILDKGFIPDINDQVFLELSLGPMLFSNQTALGYSFHIRWDFHKNYLWSFYSTGGVGGSFSNSSLPFFPRFAIGTLIHFFEQFSFRIEVSHEFSGIGVFFQF